MKAIWNNKIVAESNETKVIENNHYFPPSSIHTEYFKPSDTHTKCPWKGTASYYTLEVDGEKNLDAAWFYPETSDLAKQIENYVAFWRGVEIVE
ncbi:DUF427 domain-containing protein [Aquimarina intermedia]|uniref:Nucleotidyltransferase-like protein n=1 Tax=Aquimarina intermedia TaxID=350814 RepID=A0A5S5C941_9FLAO|nr:DUF427 domain-containing protein [Aquimarina intermedia]TYP75931.1 nucleotidyltransferase-like protein [Aquimarina intermedia]